MNTTVPRIQAQAVRIDAPADARELRGYREQLGLLQVQMAALLEITPQALSRKECGKAPVNKRDLMAAKLLLLSLDR